MNKVFKDCSILTQEFVTFEDGQRGVAIVVQIPRRDIDAVEVCFTQKEMSDALAALAGEGK